MFYTERLMLRPLDVEADTNTMTRWMNDPVIMRSIEIDAPKLKPRDHVKKFIEKRLQENEGSGLPPQFAICLKPAPDDLPENLPADQDYAMKTTADGKGKEPRYPMIGCLSIREWKLSFTNRHTGFGLCFDHPHQGKGYGQEVLLWAQDYVFNTLGFHRFELEVSEKNPRAIKCYESVGFVREGMKRKCVWVDGEWHSIIIMAMLEEEWRELRKKRNK